MKIAGALLVVFGLLALLFGGIPYQKKTNVAQIGDLHMSVKEEKQVSVPPIVSGLAILAGAGLLFASRSKRGA